jgi:hypothetical protein
MRWEALGMTVTADEKGNLALPMARPGDRFEVVVSGADTLMLTKVAPATEEVKRNKVTFVRKNGHLVGVTDDGFNEEELAKALREFP